MGFAEGVLVLDIEARYVIIIRGVLLCRPLRTDFAIEIRGLTQCLTDTLQYHQNETPTCFILHVAITSSCLTVGRKVDFTRSSSSY